LKEPKSTAVKYDGVDEGRKVLSNELGLLEKMGRRTS